VLSAGHARALLSLVERPEQQEALAGRIVAEGMSVRQTEEAVTLALTEAPADKKAPTKRTKPSAPGLTELAERLSDHFETRVRVELARRKGRLLIEFATVDDLDRIVGLIGVATPKKR
jgi:ParB family chromosome partitioning protein